MFMAFVRRHLLVILLVSAAVVFAMCAIRLPGIAADDSFIHRRIALNYEHLGKPYFNPDQRVMVTSSPLWTVLLALTGAVLKIANPVPLLELVFVLIGAAAAYLLARDRLDHDRPLGLAFAAIAFLLVFAGDLPSSMDQMESPCAIALMLTGALGVLTSKGWGMPLLVLACFTRYECVLLCLSAGIWVTARRQWTKSSLLGCIGIGLLGLAWLLREYGTVIPNTVIAKSHLYVMSHLDVARQLTAPARQTFICLVLGALWWFWGRNCRHRHNPAAIFLVGFGVLLCAAYVVRKTFIFPWYLPLVLVPLSIGVLLWTDREHLKQASVGVIFAAMILLPFARPDLKLVLAALRRAPGSAPGYPEAARVHEYRRIGAAVYGGCPSGTLMTSEIGGLGWEFHGDILDGAGLASPEAIHYHPLPIPEERSKGSLGEIPVAFVRDRHPDLIVSYDIFAESLLPAARSLGYIDYSYPLFIREDRNSAHSLWGARRMHVLVAPGGRCLPAAIDHAVRAALEE
jgi:hypothetical protein